MDFLSDRDSVCDGDAANHQAHLSFACAPGCGCRYWGTPYDTSQCRTARFLRQGADAGGGFSPAVGHDFFFGVLVVCLSLLCFKARQSRTGHIGNRGHQRSEHEDFYSLFVVLSFVNKKGHE